MGYNVSSQEEAHLKYMDLIEKQGKKAEILEEDEVKVQQNPSSKMHRSMAES